MSFSIDDVMEIIQIVKACKDTELHIDTGDIKLSLYKGDVGGASRGPLDFSGPVCINAVPEVKAAPAPVSAPLAVEAPAAVEVPPLRTGKEEFSEEGLVPIKATVTSVFYRRPSPDEPPFVEEGDEVHEESVLCLLEVMKCFRQVMAEVRGRIEKICAESNTMVEQGTTLFLIRPY